MFPSAKAGKDQVMMKLEFAAPESVHIDSTKLAKIEELAQKALDEKIMAGLNMLVARHGKIV